MLEILFQGNESLAGKIRDVQGFFNNSNNANLTHEANGNMPNLRISNQSNHLSTSTIIQKFTTLEIRQKIINNITGIKFISPESRALIRLHPDKELSAEFFESLGVVLFGLFTMNASLPDDFDLNSDDENNVHSGNEISLCGSESGDFQDEMKMEGKTCLPLEKDSEGNYTEKRDAQQKGRSITSSSHPLKSMKRTNLSRLHHALENFSLSLPIRRLVGDLMECGKLSSNEGKFCSLRDVQLEIKQMKNEPEFFLAQGPCNSNNNLEFKETTLYGRTKEIEEIVVAAHTALTDRGSDMKSVVFIGGDPGVGKSHLVNSLKQQFLYRGWLFFEAKFGRLTQNEPLSTISSGLEAYLRTIAKLKSNIEDVNLENNPVANDERRENQEEYVNVIVSSILRHLSPAGIVFLSGLIPSLKALFPEVFRSVVMDDDSVSDCDGNNGTTDGVEENCDNGNESDRDDSSVGNEPNENEERMVGDGSSTNYDDDNGNGNDCMGAGAYRNKLHYLFRQLLKAISEPSHSPIFFYVDDLQWADSASLTLLSSLVLESDHFNNADEEEARQCLFLVGSYRSNKEDYPEILNQFISEIDSVPSVRVTNISLGGIAKSGTNSMISDALRLPIRLIRNFSDVVHKKSAGNPLFVKIFMTSLVEDHYLTYSLEEQRWKWDIDNVRDISINENVAAILRNKLLRLPIKVFEALQVMSCFGVKVDQDVLSILSGSDQFDNLISSLGYAIQEGMIEKRNETTYGFAHDTIQQAVYEYLPEACMKEFHFKIGMQLVRALRGFVTPESLLCNSITFLAIDQMNRACDGTDPNRLDTRIKNTLASLNLKAAERAIDLADASSALSHVRYGLQFAGDTGWSLCYEICLRLHEAACLANYLNSSPDEVLKHFEEIINHARTFEDKIKANCIMIKSSASGNIQGAINSAFIILNQLGESFPSVATPEDIQNAIASIREFHCDDPKEKIMNAPELTDTKKLWSLKLMDHIFPYLHMMSSNLLILISARMLKISFQHGFAPESASGFFCYSYSLISTFNDIEEGYRWAKLALVVLERFNAPSLSPKVKICITMFVSIWKEPVQSSVVDFLRLHQEALLVGDIDFAAVSSKGYIHHGFISGSSLATIERECAAISLEMMQSNQLHSLVWCMNHHAMIMALNGKQGRDPFAVYKNGSINNYHDALAYAETTGRRRLMRAIYSNRLVEAFFFGRYSEAMDMAEKYRNESEISMPIEHVLNSFLEGLTAFHLARSESCSRWMELGENSIHSFRSWAVHSAWNFDNKLFLLEAESYFCHGQYDKAEEKYQSAIESSRLHRFVHEEGLACELFGSFCKTRGKSSKHIELMARARDCYKKWEAYGLLEKDCFKNCDTSCDSINPGLSIGNEKGVSPP